MRRSMRAGLAAAAGALLSAVVVAPAHAANGITWTSPQPNQTVQGTITVSATADFGSSTKVASWFVDVLDPAGGSHRLCAKTLNPPTQAATVSCLWDTTKVIGAAAVAPNGTYQVRITGRDTGTQLPPNPAADHMDQRAVNVANPASNVANVTLSFSEPFVTVSWSPVSDPDLERYSVIEQHENGPWVEVAFNPTSTHRKDTTFQKSVSGQGFGVYRYMVAAIRTGSSGPPTYTPSSPSQVTYNDPNPPTTTTTRPPTTTTRGGGGSTSGGSTSGGSTSGDSSAGGNDGTTVSGTNNGFRVVPLGGGGPGSVTATKVYAGRVVQIGGGEQDSGFDQFLPYKKGQAAQAQEQDRGGNSVVNALTSPVRVLTDNNARRALLIPIAAGLLFFVFAMQIRFLTRRAEQA